MRLETLFDVAKVLEAHLPMNQSHDALRGHVSKALRTAHGSGDGWSSDGPWIADMFPGHVVYNHKGSTYRRSYTSEQGAAGTDPIIKLGAHKPAHAAYVDTKLDEAARSIFIPAQEADPAEPIVKASEGDQVLVHEGIDFVGEVNVKESGVSKIPIKIIGPGWGGMAYYPKEVLKRDGPKVFTKGTHMMWNHATESEEADRPEGSLDNLAAVLTKDAEWKDSGPKGPGLYSEAKVFSDYATQVAEKGAHIGVSINAAIRGKEGTMEGRTGRIAQSFVQAFSTDFVTKAGAGGAPVVPVTEAAREPQKESVTMTEEETKRQKDLETENLNLKERLAKVEESQNQILAIATVAAVLKEAGVPFKQSLLERSCQSVIMKEGKPDAAWVKSIVADFSEGQEAHVKGFGDGEVKESESDKAPTEKRLKEALKGLGVPEQGLDYAVAGRV